MAAARKGLADDFNERVTKSCLPLFRKQVIPMHILPHLPCLDRIDVEVVTAQQKQVGDTLAADVLFHRLIRRPNWFEDLMKALRNPGVGLSDLADTFDKFYTTVPVHWDISKFEDSFGIACFNGHCNDIDPLRCIDSGTMRQIQTGEVSPENAIATYAKNARQPTYPDDNDTPAKKPRQEEDKPETVTADEDKKTDVEASGSSTCDESTSRKDCNSNVEQLKEQIELRRDDLKLKFMEKLYSFTEKPADFPVTLMYMEKLNCVFSGIGKGSILFNIQVKSTQDLDRLKNIWKYGTLKKLLDKELLSSEKIKELQKVAESENYPVKNITSHVDIHEADFERCKAWLAKSELEPVHILDGLAMSSAKASAGTQNMLKLSKYVRDRLPEQYRQLAEDPFILERIDGFYEQDEVKEKMEGGKKRGKGQAKSIVRHFQEWLCTEIKLFLKALETEMLHNIFMTAILIFDLIANKKKQAIPIPVQKHTYQTDASDKIKGTCIQVKVGDTRLDYIYTKDTAQSPEGSIYRKVPKSFTIVIQKLEDVFEELHKKGILHSGPHGYSFTSSLLRDVLAFCFVDDASIYSLANKEQFQYVSLVTEIFLQSLNQTVEFKQKEDTCNIFMTSDMLCYSPPRIKFYNRMEHEARKMAGVKALQLVSQNIYLDLSREIYGDVTDGDRLLDALRWVNLLDCTSSFSQLLPLRCIWTSKPPSIAFRKEYDDSQIETHLGSERAYFGIEDEIHFLGSDVPCFPTSVDSQSQSADPSLSAAFEGRSMVVADSDPSVDDIKNVAFISLTLAGQMLEQRHLHWIAGYLAVTPSLSTLCLQNCNLNGSTIKDVFKTGAFENVSHLDLSENLNLGREMSEPLEISLLVNLENLEIQNCNLDDNGIIILSEDLRHLKKLRKIDVANNRMTSIGLLEMSSSLIPRSGLTSLRIQKNPIGAHGSIILASWIKRLVLLEVLHISECDLDDDGIGLIAKSLVSKALRKLSIRNNNISKKSAICFFQNLSRPPLLEHLEFSKHAIYDHPQYDITDRVEETDHAVKTFFQAPHPWNHISMWKCGLGYGRLFRDVDQYKSLSELTYLCLQENAITDMFAEDLAKCIETHCHLIMHLNVRHNQIAEKGAHSLALSVSGKKYLEEVLLDRNMIQEQGALDILNSCCPLPRFKLLDLSCNTISEIATKRLVHKVNAEDEMVLMEDLGLTSQGVFIFRKRNGTVYVNRRYSSAIGDNI